MITKIYIDSKHWSGEYCHMRNTTEDAGKINDILDGFKMKANILAQINQANNIDFLDAPTAKAIENFQQSATQKDYVFHIKTSLDNSNELKVDRTTSYASFHNNH